MKNRQQVLAPTLWRTCRVLANKRRLQILREVIRKPGQSVSEISGALGLSMSMASQYLRALNARSLLSVARSGKNVHYGPSSADTSYGGANLLLNAIAGSLSREERSLEIAFRLATAFTHPRRLAIVRRLRAGHCGIEELKEDTAINRIALSRHLSKLVDRGFVEKRGREWRLARPDNALARVLLDLACRD